MMKLFITQFSSVSLHFIRLGLKYLPQLPSLEHPQVMFLSQHDRPSSTPIQKHTMLLFCIYEGWSFNSGNYLFTTYTK